VSTKSRGVKLFNYSHHGDNLSATWRRKDPCAHRCEKSIIISSNAARAVKNNQREEVEGYLLKIYINISPWHGGGRAERTLLFCVCVEINAGMSIFNSLLPGYSLVEVFI
jgi:hypothetical protein